MKMNFGVVAVAGISSRFVGAVKACDGVVMAAASRSLEKAQQFCDRHGIPRFYGSYEALYQDPDIDVVYIATINVAHVQEIESALSYGKHVLCEKPLALRATDARGMFALAKSKHLFLMEMQKSVFLPVTGFVKEQIETFELGQLYQISINTSFDPPVAAWMHERDQGGVVFGSTSYTLEYLDYLLEPVQTQCQAYGTREASGAVDAVSINMKMDDVLVNSRIAMRGVTESNAIFYFEHGYIKVPEHWKARSCEVVTGTERTRFDFSVEYEMQYEIQHVMECIGRGLVESPVMTAERTITCCDMVDRIDREI